MIQRRLGNAGREICGYEQYDYVLINDQLERSAERLQSIVLAERSRLRGAGAASIGPEAGQRVREQAESCRKERVEPQIVPILKSFGPVLEASG